jgi:hypothetical protein
MGILPSSLLFVSSDTIPSILYIDTIPYNELYTLIRAASTSAGSHMRGIHPAIVAE